MPGWIGPTIALSSLVLAICAVGVAITLLLAIREAAERSTSLARELAELRSELTPTLKALARLGDDGADIAEMAKHEVAELVHTSHQFRKDLARGIRRAQKRLADFEAVVEVVQEEVEETALDVTTMLQTARTGAGMLGQLRRLVLPRKRKRSRR